MVQSDSVQPKCTFGRGVVGFINTQAERKSPSAKFEMRVSGDNLNDFACKIHSLAKGDFDPSEDKPLLSASFQPINRVDGNRMDVYYDFIYLRLSIWRGFDF